MTEPLTIHRCGIRRRVTRIMRMVEAGRVSAPAPVAASELRATLRTALAGRSTEARSAFLDGLALALELGPDQIVAALEGVDLDAAKPAGRTSKSGSGITLGELSELAGTALPPRAPMQARPMPEHPLGDPDREWREPSRLLRAVMSDGWTAKDGPELLRLLDAAGCLDLFITVAEWTVGTHPDPATRAYAWRMAEAATAIRRGDKDADGRMVPLGRLLGVQPAAPTSAARKLDRSIRDDLLRRVHASVPAWRDVSARQAAPQMIDSFKRYRAGAWQADQKRETAPAVEPAATWWRISRLGLKVQMPGPEHLANILDIEE